MDRRSGEPQDPQGRHLGDHHDRGRDRDGGLLRRRRPRLGGTSQPPFGDHRRLHRQHRHLRGRQQRGPTHRPVRRDHDGGGHGDGGLFRRRRPRHLRPPEQPNGRGPGRLGEPLHRRRHQPRGAKGRKRQRAPSTQRHREHPSFSGQREWASHPGHGRGRHHSQPLYRQHLHVSGGGHWVGGDVRLPRDRRGGRGRHDDHLLRHGDQRIRDVGLLFELGHLRGGLGRPRRPHHHLGAWFHGIRRQPGMGVLGRGGRHLRVPVDERRDRGVHSRPLHQPGDLRPLRRARRQLHVLGAPDRHRRQRERLRRLRLHPEPLGAAGPDHHVESRTGWLRRHPNLGLLG